MACILANNMSLTCFMLLLCGTILTTYFINKHKLYGNFAKYIVLLGIYFSVIVMPAFHLILHTNGPLQIEYDRFLDFGSKLYFLTILVLTLFDNRQHKIESRIEHQYYPIKLSDNFIRFFFILIYSLTSIAYALGLGRMGGEVVVLPFKLTGIINLFRFYAVSFIFAAIVENYLLRGLKFPKKYYILYFVWTVFEVFAWMSKSVLVSYLLPLLILLYIYYQPAPRRILKVVGPLVALFLFLYPIIGVLRTFDSGKFVESFKEAKTEAYDGSSENRNILLEPLNRVFMTGDKYIDDYAYFHTEELFNFSNLPLVVASGGAPSFQTHVVDGFSETAQHSSGTTGIIDPLLHGGYGLCYITICLLSIISIVIDKNFYKNRVSIYCVLLIMLYNWTLFANISVLYDGNGIPTTIMEILSIFFAYQINFKNKHIKGVAG